MKNVLLSIGALIGAGITGLGLLLRFSPADNDNGTALQQFISYPVLAVGGVLLVLCVLGLIL